MSWDHVENPDAYERAIQARIRNNARIGRQRRWLTDERKALIEKLYTLRGSFAAKMIESYGEWGSLTENQERAVRKIIDQDATRAQERTAARAREAELSRHIGVEGERRDFTLAIKVVLEFETQFGTMYLHIMGEGDNVVIYKGSAKLGAKGEVITVKATVKQHGEREGCKQTIINRPKVIATTPAPTAQPMTNPENGAN